MVPVLVYALGFDPKQAVAMSLPVVGVTSVAGAVSHWRAGHVEMRPALMFGALAMAGAYAGARAGTRMSGTAQLVVLGLVMSAAGVSMLRDAAPVIATDAAGEAAPGTRWSWPIAATAIAIGVLTGLVGIGGGFLFVPALVLLGHVPFHHAVGTSLVVIAMNAAAGLAGYLGVVTIPWSFVLAFAATASAAAVVGARGARHVPSHHLRRAFGLLLLVVAGVLLAQNLSAW
jgi:uncharacterized membrane protein YfcA